jgi:hypothetical protein
MDEHRKAAYRYLLYQALLEIRPLGWLRVPLWPLHWRRELRRIRRAGEVADWFHNLAMFSALDFERFDEAWFWRELDQRDKRHPEYDLQAYRVRFEEHLARSPKNAPGVEGGTRPHQ